MKLLLSIFPPNPVPPPCFLSLLEIRADLTLPVIRSELAQLGMPCSCVCCPAPAECVLTSSRPTLDQVRPLQLFSEAENARI